MELLQEENERLKIENALLTKLLLEQGTHSEVKGENRKSILFIDFYKTWLQHQKGRIQESTFFEYTRVFERYIVPYFAPRGQLLAELSVNDIETYYKYLKITYGMSNNTLIHHHANMHACLRYAYVENYIPCMVVDKVKRPCKDPQKIFNYYTVDELLELFSLARDSNMYTPILFAAILGLSRSELLAIKWDAVNFNAGTITIMRKMTRDKANATDTLSRNLKTRARSRTLVLPRFMLLYLEQCKKRSASLEIRTYAEFVCVDGNGRLPTLNMITNRFRDFLQKHGLKKIRLHDLRHSCATMLQSLGYSMKDIQEWLGHSNFQTTANIYVHIGMGQKKKIALRLNEVLGQGIASAPSKNKIDQEE